MTGVLSLILRRLLATIPVLLVVSVIVFVVIRLAPGDPAVLVAGDFATSEQLDAIRHQMGLDRPIVIQFFIWLSDVFRGDFGVSLISGTSVRELITQRAGATIAISLYTVAYSVIIAIPLGLVAAWKRGKSLDHAASIVAVFGFSVPVFITAYVLILAFAVLMPWFPVQGYAELNTGFWNHLRYLVLPVLSLSTVYVALVTRFVRASAIEVLGQDFIRTARAKGANERRVFLHHVLPNSGIPILTIIGIAITMLIGGVVVTETVFNIPGLGRLIVDAVQASDFPVIQAVIIVFSFADILINLIIDISYRLIDPRMS